MGMEEQMRKKAKKATSATKSKEIVKTIKRCDVVELNRSMEPIIQENERMYREMSDYLAKNSKTYGSKTKILKNN